MQQLTNLSLTYIYSSSSPYKQLYTSIPVHGCIKDTAWVYIVVILAINRYPPILNGYATQMLIEQIKSLKIATKHFKHCGSILLILHRCRNWPPRFYNFIVIRFLPYKSILLSVCAPPDLNTFLL